jgi:hypothetical protein
MSFGDATSIFIPTRDEIDRRRAYAAKQFAVYIKNEAERQVWIIAPAEFIRVAGQDIDEVNDISNPYCVATIQEEEDDDLYFWLDMHNFTTPEMWILGNEVFQNEYINFLSRGLRTKCSIQIYSRPLLAVR